MDILSELLTLKRKRNDGWAEKGWPDFSLFPVARKKMILVMTMVIYDGDNDDGDKDDGDSDVLGKVGLPPHCFRRADKRSVI